MQKRFSRPWFTNLTSTKKKKKKKQNKKQKKQKQKKPIEVQEISYAN